MEAEKITVNFLHNVFQSLQVSVSFVTSKIRHYDQLDNGLRNKILAKQEDAATFHRLFRSLKKAHLYFFTDIFQCCYSILWLPGCQTWMICGPVLLNEITPALFQETLQKLELSKTAENTLREYYRQTPYIPRQVYESLLICLANEVYGKKQYHIIYDDGHELDNWYNYYQNYHRRLQEFPQSGVNTVETLYEQENNMLEAIERADEEKIREIISRFKEFPLSSRLPSALRDMKDYCITCNTLMRKSAERAGVHPIYIDSASNYNVQQIEKLTTKQECLDSIGEMALGYCKLIRQYTLTGYSALIRNAITYINTNIQSDLSLGNLAKHLSVNASYLSSLFKKELGCTLTDYVNQTRISHACKLLLNSDMAIKHIAAASGIPDVHYFNRLFKRTTGMTPGVYREMSPDRKRLELSMLNGTVRQESIRL